MQLRNTNAKYIKIDRLRTDMVSKIVSSQMRPKKNLNEKNGIHLLSVVSPFLVETRRSTLRGTINRRCAERKRP